MHLLQDENGNNVSHAHGGEGKASLVHTHDGHTHEHEDGHSCGGEHNCSTCKGDCTSETVALLSYMLQHNQHHAAELDQMAANLRKLGMEAAANQISEGVSEFQKGNMRLSLALALVREELKEE